MSRELPDKLYFKIGEVARLTGVKSHVLRYWESEFSTLRPGKSRGKQRLYRQQDIDRILFLKDLLYNQGYTIAGARKLLRGKPAKSDPPVGPVAPTTDASAAAPSAPVDTSSQMFLPFSPPINMRLLKEIRQDLLALKKSLGVSS
ncbi:MAG: MerR family transcriptional regulator [Desulfuromonadales bacterium]|nr:MerR family transcriptional regulator [Desulfuromonadales bacterium]